MSSDTNCKQRIKLWDWVVRFKDTSCKATYKIKDLSEKFYEQCLSVINLLIIHVSK